MLILEKDEIMIAKVRKHWWLLFTWGLRLSLLAILPLIVFGVISAMKEGGIETRIIYIFGFFYSMWVVVLWVLFFVEWTDYRFDMWVITNQRIVDIDQAGLFARDIATVRLKDIEDITVEMYGIFSTMLKFGTLMIQTAGSKNEFYLKNARNPEEAKRQIYSLIHALENKEQD